MIKFLDLLPQYYSIKEEIDEAINEVIKDTSFVGGKYVKTFEKNFALYVGSSYCVGVGNGTDAIEIAIEALNLPKNSEIIVPANSFIATSEAVTRTQHKIVFADIDPKTHNINPEIAENLITSETSALIAVHLYGNPCDLDGLRNLCDKYSLFLIEDCAQAHSSYYKNKHVGTFGDISTFSFYPGKNLGAYGDGGAIVTNDSILAEKCRMIANHGRKNKFDHVFEGRNSRLDSIQASILNVKLKYLDNWIKKRRSLADKYIEVLSIMNEIEFPYVFKYCLHSYHLFVIRLNERDQLRNYLNAFDIQTGIHYPKALPDLLAYSTKNNFERSIASKYSNKILSLPIGDHLNISDVEFICSKIISFYNR